MAEKSHEEYSISTEDVDRFVRKLEGWASGLDAGDRALLEVVLAHSRGEATEKMDLSFSAEGGIGQAVAPFLREKAAGLSVRLPKDVRPQRPRAWVEAGDPWIQSG